MKMPLGRPNCFPLFQKFSVLIENLYAIVVAIGDEEPSLGIDGDGVGSVEPRRTKGTASVGVGKVLPTQAALESPGPVPFFPHALMNVPSFENFTMRAFESPPCPSATNMSPFEATALDRGVPKRGAHCTLSSQDLALGGLGLPPLAPPKIGGGISPYRMGARNRYRFSPWIKATAVPLKMRVPFLIQKGWSEAGVRSTAVGAIQRSL